jgi:26S proteasome regulatory subunit RPN6 N-terminal domain
MASTPDSKLDARVAAANEALESDPKQGISQLRQIIGDEKSDADAIKAKEQAIGSLTKALADAGEAQSLEQLLTDLKPLYQSMPKAKTAKIVRTVIDALARIPNTAPLQVRSLALFGCLLCSMPIPCPDCDSTSSLCARAAAPCSCTAKYASLSTQQQCMKLVARSAIYMNYFGIQIKVCKEQIEWARQEKRSFLRQRIEMRLASLLIEVEDYQPASQLVNNLLTEVKKLDDKLLLVDVHLIESRLHHLLINTPKSKAALTAARSAANAVYVPPGLQVRPLTPSCVLNLFDLYQGCCLWF